jgi:hypothetical protein
MLSRFGAGIRSYTKSKNWQGVLIDLKLKTWKERIARLTSQMCKIKALRKLRCKPQGSEVFRCGSMGIVNGWTPVSYESQERFMSS